LGKVKQFCVFCRAEKPINAVEMHFNRSVTAAVAQGGEMTRYAICILICACSLLIFPARGFAQIGHVVNETRLVSSPLEERIAVLENELRLLQESASLTDGTRQQPACESCCTCCPSNRFQIGADVLFLRPHSSTGLGPEGIAYFANNEIFPSWRAWIGLNGPNGVGVRLRHFEFDQILIAAGDSFGLDTKITDLELTCRKQFGEWNVLVSGGARYVNFHEDRFINGQNASRFVDTDLTGIVIGGEIARPLFCGISGYGIVRSAAAYGDMTGQVPQGNVVVLDEVQSFMWEAQLGLEMQRMTGLGNMTVRFGVEAQNWDDISFKAVSGTNSVRESIGLFGFVGGLSFSR
jgi:hypothetical protein